MDDSKILAANFFGQLQVVYNGVSLTEDTIHSEMISKLFAYILINHRRVLTIRELSDVLWGESEGSDNPAGALKNLMYRLRNVLKKAYGAEEQFVVTSSGSYSWNSDIMVILDVEEFETNVKQAKICEDIEESIIGYEKAVNIYQGRFFDKHSCEHWVVPLSTYYHSLFLTAVKTLASLYEKQKRYEKMEGICTKALGYDNLDEEIHCYELYALIHQGKQSMALEHYEKTAKLFYDALGVRKLPKLEEVYQKALSMKKASESVHVDEISRDVREHESPNNAYVCGYAIFREIYRIEARRISRMGISEHILFMTLSLKQKVEMTESMERYLMNRVMDRMEQILISFLRAGDVVSRYSDSQFLVLLPVCTYESAMMIAQRLVSQFKKDFRNQKYKVDCHVEEMMEVQDNILNR